MCFTDLAEACCGEITTDAGFAFPECEQASCLAALEHPLLPEVLFNTPRVSCDWLCK